MKERLGARRPVTDQLVFPSQEAMAAADAPCIDHGRRPLHSHKVIASTSAMEQQLFLLQQHAIVVTAASKNHATNPYSIGKAVEREF